MKFVYRLSVAFLAVYGASIASASSLNFNGTFLQDDNQAAFNITLNLAGPVTIATNSYASGGFATVLSLFGPVTDSDPFLLSFDAGPGGNPCGARQTNPTSGLCLDALLGPISLSAGLYRVILTEQDNTPNGPDLAAGFNRDGQGNFTAVPGNSGPFVDPSNNSINDTGNWAISFQNVATAEELPEPSTVFYLVGGLGILVGLRGRRAS